MEYLRFALRESSCRSLAELLEMLSKKLPHIPTGSIRMKIQNIKAISLEFGLDDGVEVSPLDQYSAQSKFAFKCAIKEILREDPPEEIPISVDPVPPSNVRIIHEPEELDSYIDLFCDDFYLGESVIHKFFGEGVVTEVEKECITVSFPQKKAKFRYPEAFDRFLQFKDQFLQRRIIEGLTFFRKEREIQKRMLNR